MMDFASGVANHEGEREEGQSLSEPELPDITRILEKVSSGDPHAAHELLPLVYEQLRAAARKQMAQERSDHTLQATALVHEAYVRLVGSDDVSWENRAHFYVAAAEAMRRVLMEHARKRGRAKRGGADRKNKGRFLRSPKYGVSNQRPVTLQYVNFEGSRGAPRRGRQPLPRTASTLLPPRPADGDDGGQHTHATTAARTLEHVNLEEKPMWLSFRCLRERTQIPTLCSTRKSLLSWMTERVQSSLIVSPSSRNSFTWESVTNP